MRWSRRSAFIVGALLVLAGAVSTSASPSSRAQAKLVKLDRIWDKAPHNAFPALMRYQNRFYLALRESNSLVSPDGAIRILSSIDGQDWRPVAMLAANGDLSRPKMTITAGSQMLLTAELKTMRPPSVEYQTMRWTSKDGTHWTERGIAADINFVLGQPVLHGKGIFALAARKTAPYIVRMYGGPDDTLKRVYTDAVYTTDRPSEPSLLFPSPDLAVSILRCEGGIHEYLGLSKFPFRKWNWKGIDPNLSDVQMLKTSAQQIIVGGRSLQPKQQTSLSTLDLKKGRIDELFVLPSGGDTGSPSMVLFNGYLWVAYHSTHYRNTSIYLARLKLP